MRRCAIGLTLAVTGLFCLPNSGWATDSDDIMIGLKPWQPLVGQWAGSGSFLEQTDANGDTKGWDESFRCAWRFGPTGRVSIYFVFDKNASSADGRLLDEAMLTYHPERKRYTFMAYKNAKGDDVIRFEGEAKSETNIILDRVNKGNADDKLDRLDIKLLNGGDRVVYNFSGRVGQSTVYRPFAQVALDRDGTSLAGAGANQGPVCIVTGGKGITPVSYMGKTYYVCCSGCLATFNDNPAKWVAKLEAQGK